MTPETEVSSPVRWRIPPGSGQGWDLGSLARDTSPARGDGSYEMVGVLSLSSQTRTTGGDLGTADLGDNLQERVL